MVTTPAAQSQSADQTLSGIIVKGDGRGRSLGFPTANLILEQTFPFSPGIYAAWANLNDEPKKRPAVIHAGPRPTFLGTTPTVEVHLLDFPDRDLYGQRLTLMQLQFIRPIEKFDSVDHLIAAIQQDCHQARSLLSL